MKKILIVLSLCALGGALSACANTLDGAGRDISKAGETIQRTF
ncbi:MAG: entericidin A/B family lipoprotein [Alphaproteobacteria bacterium]|nr:entericidin A/B family lipoprotein [Alphaproteobacteria bacterium]